MSCYSHVSANAIMAMTLHKSPLVKKVAVQTVLFPNIYVKS